MVSSMALEIPREAWADYFNDLGRIYAGWSVAVEVLLGQSGDQRRIDDLPLRGLSYDTKGSQAGDILIEAGDLDLPYEVHRIPRPRLVRAASTQPGAEIDLEIESEDGPTAVIRIRPYPELPPAEPR